MELSDDLGLTVKRKGKKITEALNKLPPMNEKEKRDFEKLKRLQFKAIKGVIK